MRKAMPLAMEKVLPEARAHGIAQAEAKYQAMLLGAVDRAWRRRFDADLPSTHRPAIAALSSDRLLELSEAIPDFTAPRALAAWLRRSK